MDERSSVNKITAERCTWYVYFKLLSKYIIFKIINDESDVSSIESKDSSNDDEEISDVEPWQKDNPNLNDEHDASSDYYVFFYSISNTLKYEAVVNFLKVGSPSGSLTRKLWLKCQIRWPWMKGPVLTRSLPKDTLGMFISNYCQSIIFKIISKISLTTFLSLVIRCSALPTFLSFIAASHTLWGHKS